MKLKAVFFAKVTDLDILQRNEFYAVDLRILNELGFEVLIVTNPLRIPKADLYFVWWWTWAFFPLVWAKLLGKPVVIAGVFDHVINGSWVRYSSRPVLHRLMINLSLLWADANIFMSKLELNHALNTLKVHNPYYSYAAIDSEVYHPCDHARENFLLSFCWMDKENAVRKCVAESIRAMAILHDKYPDLKLIICGDKLGDYPRLARLVDDLGAQDYICFPGTVSREHKVSLMQRCAVYLQPTRVEGFGVAIAEAMACGTAVVTSPVGAVPEVVGNTAVLVEGTSPETIAEGVSSLLDDEKRRDELGQLARERVVDLFCYERRKVDVERVINGVMNNRRKDF